MKKYVLTANRKVVDDVILHQIKAIKDFGDVEEGDLGGWIQKEDNLSHEGEAWVSDNAMVYGDATVLGNACVTGNAEIFGHARIQSEAFVGDHAKVSGYAFIAGDSRISDFAQIGGGAMVTSSTIFGKAIVERNASVHFACIGGRGYIVDKDEILSISNIWSVHDPLTAYVTLDKHLELTYKNFCGSPEEFEDYLQKEIKENSHQKKLKAAVEFIRVWHGAKGEWK
ncbi:hypothetical protein [Paenibacillus campinasensis]|uniref:Transferase n=1 Tax=Paenibacillus campinasensis TaxID=66347 RepID=A0A268EIG0_9BACL|nr:hypothetical protein [Paenibacillus campinasensis]PAD72864.1 hypothetical protein CHH67_21395 [Paenibacillus campinasensis]